MQETMISEKLKTNERMIKCVWQYINKTRIERLITTDNKNQLQQTIGSLRRVQSKVRRWTKLSRLLNRRAGLRIAGEIVYGQQHT